jgi:hypothetical protein
VVIEAIPKLRDEREAFIGGQTGDFVGGELHGRQISPKTATLTSWRCRHDHFVTVTPSAPGA